MPSLQVLAEQSTDGNAVVKDQLLAPRSRPVLYAKHMGKHKLGITGELFKRAQHMVRHLWVAAGSDRVGLPGKGARW